ncbi:FG-GAP repeat domain-containing protein [Nocardia sp. NPDC052566]|uniref:FG-GAP repeat domain-containing protein n=1 Tax=Nocardia sp. NPDC052566 TaxID=3364330 RepID=UPI0037C95540
MTTEQWRAAGAAAVLVAGLAIGGVGNVSAAPPTGSGSGSAGPNPLFEESVQYPSGGLGPGVGSQTMAVGDLDGDGNVDVASTGLVDGVAILRGDGTGRLDRIAFYHTEVGANAVAAADLRGTGSLDLVVTNFLSVTVLFNDGHGNFTVDRTYSMDFNPNVTRRTGGIPFGAALADYNHDGRPDLAFNNLVPIPGAIAIMDNDGAGHFAAPRWIPAGIGRSTVLAGDLNGDGWPDLVTGDLGTLGFWAVLNDRRGGFEVPRWNLLPLPDEDLKLDDVDGDGNLDVVSANIAAFSFSVQYGNGRGNFGAPQITFGAIAPCAVAVADFDGDGRKDIAALQYLPSTAMIYRNNGDRTFTYLEQHTIGLGPQAAEVAELRRDRQPSLVSMSSLSQDVAVLVNRVPKGDQ